MEPVDIPDGLHGQRTLAAIVFSDVVSFSARMGRAEEHTLKLVRRDLDIMKELCEKHEGQVLKTTGDGLLMYFNSAVQAVACSLDIQNGFAEFAAKLSPENVLKHRIGIHLGDVFVSESDVMGDGVNIAARLQSEAAPGGICISQTVYDVVKNRLGIRTTFLGPRELKNIKDAVPVYRILLEAQKDEPAPEAPPPPPEPVTKTAGTPVWAKVTLTVLALLVVAALVRRAARRRRPGEEEPPAAVETASVDDSRKPVEPPAFPEPSPATPADPAARRRALQKRYDFEGLAGWAKEHGDLRGTPKQEALIQHYEKLASFSRWFDREMDKYSEFNPLPVRLSEKVGGGTVAVWKNDDGTYSMRRGDHARTLSLDEIKPPLMASMMRETVHRANPNKLQRMKLNGALMLFATEYNLWGSGVLHDPSGKQPDAKPPRRKPR